MSAVLESGDTVSNIGTKASGIEIREGDWKAYLSHLAKGSKDKTLVERYGDISAYKRACAMAYLGRRAQLHGGVCSTLHPHIMTQQFIHDLEVSNKSIRYTRYPWLQSLMNLLEEIELIQDQISNNNVISLVPPSKN